LSLLRYSRGSSAGEPNKQLNNLIRSTEVNCITNLTEVQQMTKRELRRLKVYRATEPVQIETGVTVPFGDNLGYIKGQTVYCYNRKQQGI